MSLILQGDVVHSREKADWMVGVIETWFCENRNLQATRSNYCGFFASLAVQRVRECTLVYARYVRTSSCDVTMECNETWLNEIDAVMSSQAQGDFLPPMLESVSGRTPRLRTS